MTRNDDVDVVEIDRDMASKLDTTRINGNVVVVRGRAAAITVMIWNHFHVHIRNKYDSSFQIMVFIALVYCSWMLDVGWCMGGSFVVVGIPLCVVWGGACGFVSSDSSDVLGWHSLEPLSKMRSRNED
jgi:hypothetical protein